jgi:acyl dehydratase
MTITTGTTLSYERTFTRDDVERFAELSGDRGRHHRVGAADGRLLVHGLLTASLPTKLGGDIDYIAADMHFEFVAAVYTGDTIRCELTIDEAIEGERNVRVRLSGACENQDGAQVMRFSSHGLIRRPR